MEVTFTSLIEVPASMASIPNKDQRRQYKRQTLFFLPSKMASILKAQKANASKALQNGDRKGKGKRKAEEMMDLDESDSDSGAEDQAEEAAIPVAKKRKNKQRV